MRDEHIHIVFKNPPPSTAASPVPLNRRELANHEFYKNQVIAKINMNYLLKDVQMKKKPPDMVK
ncbi:MAG: hypothetical protein LBR06_00010 [Bacteroidales bacterium]|nr:hypothetical protein [Bacteroidales bacterium]